MANCKKATRGAMGHLMKHYERGKDANGEYIKFGNQQIDSSRTHLNYNLAPEHDQLDFIQNRLKEVSVLKRKDVNVMCSWVVTAPKELPEEHQKEFFERTYNFLRERYSPDEKNIISAYVHMDEATPHMHFAFVPVVHDQKKDIDKVSAKEVVNRTDLKTFHKDFQAVMDRFVEDHAYSFDCNVLNGATAGGNKSIEEYKAAVLSDLNKEETERLNELMSLSGKETLRVKEASQERTRLLKDVSSLKRNKNTVLKELEVLEGKLDVLEGDQKTLMQKFVSHPQIKPMFDKFCRSERGKIKEHQEQRKSVRSSLSTYQKEVNQSKKDGIQPEQKRRLDRNER
ncbi:MAG: plasmid recombination protein [Lachnospiraceae bacterium]|nr:plasmid recombination protein [Lachnospiraceae bacterium]